MRKTKNKINGVFLLDKACGISSNKALQEIKHFFNAEKAGHTGTLDPLATGVLPILLGEATKFASFLLDAQKTYKATLMLGSKTTTGDREGEIIETKAIPVLTEETIKKVLLDFIGESLQTPPMYSALKLNGQPLYKLARSGVEVEISPRKITIYDIKLLAFSKDSITIEVTCSKGTYIRVLAEDIAIKLNTLAHLKELQRVASGKFNIDQCLSFHETLQLTQEQAKDTLLQVQCLVEHFPNIKITTNNVHNYKNGNKIMLGQNFEQGYYQVFNDNTFLGLGVVEQQFLLPKRLVNYE